MWQAILSSADQPFDPMEKALRAHRAGLEATCAPAGTLQLIKSYGLRPGLLTMTNIWRLRDGQSRLIAAKGAPEDILKLCCVPEADLPPVRVAVDAMAAGGLRVLGVAKAVLAEQPWPESQSDLPLVFIGLVGLWEF